MSTEAALKLLMQFRAILQRESLQVNILLRAIRAVIRDFMCLEDNSFEL